MSQPNEVTVVITVKDEYDFEEVARRISEVVIQSVGKIDQIAIRAIIAYGREDELRAIDGVDSVEPDALRSSCD